MYVALIQSIYPRVHSSSYNLPWDSVSMAQAAGHSGLVSILMHQYGCSMVWRGVPSVEKAVRDQANSRVWLRMRAGRITALNSTVHVALIQSIYPRAHSSSCNLPWDTVSMAQAAGHSGLVSILMHQYGCSMVWRGVPSVEKADRDQANYRVWLRMRAGRITVQKLKKCIFSWFS